MKMFGRIITTGSVALLAGLAFFSCDSEINRQEAPVLLIASVTDIVNVIDLADPDCPDPTVELEISSRVKDTTLPGGGLVDTRFLDVILRTRRSTYVRTDGGTLAPRPFLENTDVLIPVNGTADLPPSLIFAPGAITEAPFAALFPDAGGRDPETGRSFVTLEVIEEYFGETLSGEKVSTSVRYPLTICIDCGGCQPSGSQ